MGSKVEFEPWWVATMRTRLGYQSFTQHTKETKRGLLISSDWVKDLYRLGERSLTTGIVITHPKRFLMVTKGFLVGSSAISIHFIQSINQAAAVTYLTRGKK